mmetsp:Transcript_19368/g.49271  ORF Transcript_19368/g.49271 Transcript_19368/m.49271 type:complete len:314 (-) Transcript_19368:134-1075(-)
MAWPGGMRSRRGSRPRHMAPMPSSAGILTRASKKPLYLMPSGPCLDWAMSRVLVTSKGPVATGPRQAARNPEVMDWPGVSCLPSPSCLSHRNASMLCLAQNRHIWLVPLRMMVGVAPDHMPLMPSSLSTVVAQWMGPLYFRVSLAVPFCCCSLILTTSKGVTMISASVMPAMKPAAMRRPSVSLPSSLRSRFWYTELEPMRSAYFRVRCVAKGVRPFHRDLTPSSAMIVCPQCTMPRYLPARSSCSLVLITSIGCSAHASATPPREPARPLMMGPTFAGLLPSSPMLGPLCMPRQFSHLLLLTQKAELQQAMG